MSEEEELVYGYLMDVKNVVKFVVQLQPRFRKYIEENQYAQWQLQVYCFALKEIGRMVGIRDLQVRTVWLGGGLIGSIWALPDRFFPTFISAEDKPKFEKLKKLFGDKEPAAFYVYGYDEPEDCKNDVVQPHVVELALNNVAKAFNEDGKAVMREILSETEP